MNNSTEWAAGSNTHSLQHITYGGGTFVIRSADQVYIGDGNTWLPSTATEVYDYFVKIDRDAKTRFANMTLWQRLKLAFKGDMS